MASEEERVLYRDSKITISQRESIEDHNLVLEGVRGGYCLLQHGILDDLAKRDDVRLREGLAVMNDSFLFELEHTDISLDYLGRALAQAKIKELEYQLSDAYGQVRELREKVQA